jgi:site-specific recombinase XerD
MLLTLLNTGLRPAEVFQIEWQDINFKGKTLTVRGEIAKSGKTRHVPLNKEALGVLLQWSNQQPKDSKPKAKVKRLVFPSPVNGEAMVKIPKAVYRVFSSAKLKNFRPYDLRHTFASKLVMKGVDLNTVRELLGHRDIATTLIYAHLAPDHKASAVELLNDG